MNHANATAPGPAGRTDVTFAAGDGTSLAAWLYRPEGPPPDEGFPCIVMSHGFGGLRRMGLDSYASVFAAAGLASLVYDHRNWGDSGGEPRYETNPWQQVDDMRDAVTFARQLDGVDATRIGVWGTSFAGGHALVMGALDRRVSVVVAQVPFVDGANLGDDDGDDAALVAALDADRDARFLGQPPRTTRLASDDSPTADWARQVDVDGVWPNRTTLRSLELMATYSPTAFASRITPTPMLMIVADEDEWVPASLQLAAYEAAAEPKELLRLPCKHYDPYTTYLDESATAACEFLVRHLSAAPSVEVSP